MLPPKKLRKPIGLLPNLKSDLLITRRVTVIVFSASSTGGGPYSLGANSSSNENLDRVKEILKKERAGAVLSEQDRLFLDNVNLADFLEANTQLKKEGSSQYSPLVRGDVIETTFFLKNLQMREITGKALVYKNTLSLIQPNNRDIENLNAFTQSFRLYYVVSGYVGQLTFLDALSAIKTHVWDDHIVGMVSSDVCLEAGRARIVYPFSRTNSSYALGFNEFGNPNLAQTLPATRPFVFQLGTSLVSGGRDDYSIRIPFVSDKFLNINYMGDLGNKPVAKQLEQALAEPIQLGEKNTKTGEKPLFLELVLKTTRQKALRPFLPVESVVTMGFNTNVGASRTKLSFKSAATLPNLSNLPNQNPNNPKINTNVGLSFVSKNKAVPDHTRQGTLDAAIAATNQTIIQSAQEVSASTGDTAFNNLIGAGDPRAQLPAAVGSNTSSDDTGAVQQPAASDTAAASVEGDITASGLKGLFNRATETGGEE